MSDEHGSILNWFGEIVKLQNQLKMLTSLDAIAFSSKLGFFSLKLLSGGANVKLQLLSLNLYVEFETLTLFSSLKTNLIYQKFQNC